ncbi:WD repeat-containing protein 93 [Echeneis naucrates]|uniref:WD repeat-containing protein 93 n=1 Tax=Echeneis naucrates TaxID=173247 RepID=UPI0011139FEE|nr:WD repeat-containing protein 93 [Echeneis naucrates]
MTTVTPLSSSVAPGVTFSNFVHMKLPESTNCLACSEDGMYLSLGHAHGLSVWCVSSLTCVAERLEDRLEITSIQMSRITEKTYLLATIDDMGVARVFAYHCDSIHLLSTVNSMENVNKRSICLTFELSQGGYYGVAAISCNSAVWLEVYRFPSEAWLKELEMAVSHIQESNCNEDVDLKWTPLSVVTKIKPPEIPEGTEMEGPDEVQTTDFLMHYLALDILTKNCKLETHSFKSDEEKTHESQRCCTVHFLLPCGQFPGDLKIRSQPESPVAFCVWWSDSHNLLQYQLHKARNFKPDVEPVPYLFWPNTKKILCSAVTRCTQYIALGLDSALVCIWDRQSGAPFSVVLISAADCVISRMQFVDDWPVSGDDTQSFNTEEVHLLVACKSGAIHTINTGRGRQSRITLLTDSPKDTGDLPTVIVSVPTLRSLVLRVQRNGKIFLHDVLNKQTLCTLIPPKTHSIATPCSPVYALNSKRRILFIRGDQDTSYRPSSQEYSQSQLFIFHFGESDSLQKYVVSPSDSPQRQKTLSYITLEETCDRYLQQRALSADARSRAFTQTWKELQEAVMAQQGHS